MTKKVKWTVISTVTLSLLTFGGLVADHTQELNGASAEGSFDGHLMTVEEAGISR